MLHTVNWETKVSRRLREPHFQNSPETRHRLIIELNRAKTDRICSIVESNLGKVTHELSLIPAVVVEFPYHALRELALCKHVRKIWHDAPVYSALDIAVPAVGGKVAHDAGLTGKNITVAVLDTGIHPHPDFTKLQNRIFAWNDLVNQKNEPYDDNGHGTHVAGIIAGNGHSSEGKYVGMAPDARLVGVKVLDEDGGGASSTVISGIEWCLKNRKSLNIRIINLSMGSTAQESYKDDPLCRAVMIAWQQGLVVCCAAGNEGPDGKTIDSPGITPQIITVGNFDSGRTISDTDDTLSKSSSRGPTFDNLPKPDLLAPGTDITSTWVDGGYKTLSGTSMATPMVSGAAALILQKWPSMTPSKLKDLLIRNARDLGLGPNLQGAGALQLEKIFSKPPVNHIFSKLHSAGVSRLLGSQLLYSLFQMLGIDAPAIKAKRNEILQQSAVSFFFG